MNDPRWQRAMERLGLCFQGPSYGGVPSSIAPDPDDPATFLRVVEALVVKGCYLYISKDGASIEDPCRSNAYDDGIFVMSAATLYEAVMEAFGNDSLPSTDEKRTPSTN